MSEPAPKPSAPATTVDTSLSLLAWRSALAAGPSVPSVADLTDWARRLADAGCAKEAALLDSMVALDAGFSPRAMAVRGQPFGHATPTAGDDMATRAREELRQIGIAAGKIEPANPVRHGFTGKRSASDDAPEIIDQLRDLLGDPLADRGAELTATLRALVAPERTSIDYRVFASGPLTILAHAIVAVALVDFAQRTRDLWGGPMGSPALMHRAARLDNGGLGPYLRNVGRLARGSRDVTAMARTVSEAAGPGSVLTYWIALLSRGCDRGLVQELIDDLGDMAAGDALQAMLEHMATFTVTMIDVGLVSRVRDAALDNADHALAAQAQRLIVRVRPDSDLEGMILGDIEASGGDRIAAALTFQRLLVRSPEHADVRARLDALQAGRFSSFAVLKGYGSPADRQDTRLRRRGIVPDRPRRRGKRIDAVEIL